MTDQRPEVTEIQISSTSATDLADRIAELPGLQVLRRSGPYPNRRDPGERIYMTVTVREDN